MTPEQEDALNKARAILKLPKGSNNIVRSQTFILDVSELKKRFEQYQLEQKQMMLN